MDRLVCGDVGYGKTEIAIRAAFKAVQDGNLEEGSFLCGAIAGMVKKVQPAKEIVEEMFAEAEKLLNR